MSSEQHVTNNTGLLLLYALEDALPGVEFAKTDECTTANPDIVAVQEETVIVSADKFESPSACAKARATAQKEMENAARLTFETKPFWKFRILMQSVCSTATIIKLWSVPRGYSVEDMRQQKPLLQERSPEKRKSSI